MSLPLPAHQMTVGTKWRYSNGGLHAAFDYPVPIGTQVFGVATAQFWHATTASRTSQSR
jgi:hypothetical protein